MPIAKLYPFLIELGTKTSIEGYYLYVRRDSCFISAQFSVSLENNVAKDGEDERCRYG